MMTFWFLIIVFLSPTDGAYVASDMIPRVAPSEVACLAKRDQVIQIHREVRAMDPTIDDAEVFCWEATGHLEIQKRLVQHYGRKSA